jgi:hypothetical protein
MTITLCETEPSTILAPAQLAGRAEDKGKELQRVLAMSMVDTVHHTSRVV